MTVSTSLLYHIFVAPCLLEALLGDIIKDVRYSTASNYIYSTCTFAKYDLDVNYMIFHFMSINARYHIALSPAAPFMIIIMF